MCKISGTRVFFYTYDPLNLTSETLANGVITNYSYDSGNRLNQVGSESLQYDQNSNIIKKGTDTYIYDQLNQIAQSLYGNTRFGTGMQGNGYNYDLMGNRYNEENIRIITKTTRTGAVVTTEKRKVWNYEANSLNQYSDILTQSGTVTIPTNTGITNTGSTNTGTTSSGITNTGTDSTGESMNTASGGSGVETVGASGSTGTGGAELTSFSTPETFGTFSPESTGSSDTGSLAGRLLYDNNGNLVGNTINNKREYEYTYDAQNRLINVSRYNTTTDKEVLMSFSYDGLGRRSTKQVQNQRIEYIYSGNDVIEETMSIVNPTTQAKVKKELREYIYGSKGTDDIISVTITPYTRVNKVDIAGIPNMYYYEKDHLGSITRITTNTGGIVDEYSYTVFGKAYKKNPDGIYKPVLGLKSSIGNTRLYTGREYDREINLYYNRARYYDANMGRFISRDPIGMKDNVNLYTYVANSPVMYTDRQGTDKQLFIKNNEGNAWYFAKPTVSFLRNGVVDTPHASLYFIHAGKEYMISFGPQDFDWNVLGGDVKSGDIADTGHEESYLLQKDYFRSMAMNPKWYDNENSIKIDAEYLDSSKLLDFYNTELNSINQPDYNLYINNCSHEVRKALKSAGFFDTYFQYDPLSTPNSLGRDITGELQYKSIKTGLQSLFQ